MKKPKDSRSLQEHKADLHRETFHVQQIDDRITAYQFERLSREVLIQWGDLVRVERDNFPEPIRILFDFRGAGAPSRYMVDRMPRIFEDLNFPDNTRIAVVMDDDRTARFVHNAVAQWPDMGQVEEFINIDPAIQWLTDELPKESQDESLEENAES